MKAIIAIAICGLFSIQGFAQINQNQNTKYCASFRDGLMVLTENEMVINNDVILNDSTRVTKDAVVVKKDGSKVILNEGECIDVEGNILVARLESNKTIKRKKK